MLHPERLSLASLGPEFYPNNYTQIIRKSKSTREYSLRMMVNRENPDIVTPKALIDANRFVLKIRKNINTALGRGAVTAVEKQKEVGEFLSGYKPGVVEAVMVTSCADRNTRKARDTRKQLVFWEEYLGDKTARDQLIAAHLLGVNTSLAEITQNQQLTSAEKRKHETMVVNNALQEMKGLAPQALLKYKIKGEKYNPRSAFNSKILEFCEGKLPARQNQYLERITEQQREIRRLKQALQTAEITQGALSISIGSWSKNFRQKEEQLKQADDIIWNLRHPAQRALAEPPQLPGLRDRVLGFVDSLGNRITRSINRFWGGLRWHGTKTDIIDGIAIPVT